MHISMDLIKKIISFTFWGVLTTLVNILSFYLVRLINTPIWLATFISWFVSVLFAFFTNRKFVFTSDKNTKSLTRELFLFYSSRAFSGLMDILIMILLVNILCLNEIFSKIVDEFLVSLFNFLFSFLVIFNKKEENIND